MTTTNTTEMTNVGAAAAVSSQLITIKPEKYVEEVYKPFREQLKKEIKEHGKLSFVSGAASTNKNVIDIQSKDGMTIAKAMRSAFKRIRIDAEAERKERKKPITDIAKLLDTAYKDLETEVSEYEDRADKAIKAEEQRIEEEKQRKIAAERARVEAIENRIAQIRNVPLQLAAASSVDVVKAIQQHSDLVLDPADFDEYLEDGINAVNATLVELEKVRVRAVERETAEAKAKAEREELARLREEQAKRDAEAKAAEEQRRKESEAKDAELAALRAQIAAMQKPVEPAQAAEEKPAAVSRDITPAAIPVIRTMEVAPRKRPTDVEIVDVLADHFAPVERETVIGWLRTFDATLAY